MSDQGRAVADLLYCLLAAPGADYADETRQQHYENIQGRHKEVRIPHAQGVHDVLVHMEPAVNSAHSSLSSALCSPYTSSMQQR